MDQFLSIAASIATPLSLAALVVLVLFGLFKTALERLNLRSILPPDTFQLVKRLVTFVFILALVALVLGLLAYAVPPLVEKIWQRSSLDTYVAQLNSSSEQERLSAIGRIEAIAATSSEAATTACDVLSSFVRSGTGERGSGGSRLPSDFQRAMAAISYIKGGQLCDAIDLSGAKLERLSLPSGHLRRVNLSGANLSEANLSECDLSESILTGSDLSDAVVSGGNLIKAALQAVKWNAVNLRSADLSGAIGLTGSDLRTALIDGASFKGTDLRGAHFPQTVTGVNLTGADLRETDLSMVRGICRDVLAKAVTDSRTKGPINEC